MVGIFRNFNPLGIIFLFFYGLVLRFAAFVMPQVPVPNEGDGFLYKFILSFLSPVGKSLPVMYSILAYLLVFIQAMMVNGLVNHYRMLSRSTFLPAMSYILVASLFPEWWEFSAALLINTLIVWVWSQMTGLYNSQRALSVLFSAGVVLGLCSLIYFPSVAFVLLMILSLVVMRPFKLAEWVVALISVTIPYYFLFAWLYLSNKWNPSEFIQGITVHYPGFKQDLWALGGVFFLIVPFLASGYYIQGNILRMLIQVRKSWSLLLLYLLTALIVPFISPSGSFAYWILCVPPFAAFHSNVYLQAERKWISALLHWAMVLFILALNIYVLSNPGQPG